MPNPTLDKLEEQSNMTLSLCAKESVGNEMREALRGSSQQPGEIVGVFVFVVWRSQHTIHLHSGFIGMVIYVLVCMKILE